MPTQRTSLRSCAPSGTILVDQLHVQHRLPGVLPPACPTPPCAKTFCRRVIKSVCSGKRSAPCGSASSCASRPASLPSSVHRRDSTGSSLARRGGVPNTNSTGSRRARFLLVAHWRPAGAGARGPHLGTGAFRAAWAAGHTRGPRNVLTAAGCARGVVSQDGTVRFVKWRKGVVIYWEQVATSVLDM